MENQAETSYLEAIREAMFEEMERSKFIPSEARDQSEQSAKIRIIAAARSDSSPSLRSGSE